jgi:solute carrier family 25 citrate transporter 1
MHGFLHGTTIILKERGLPGLFQGFIPTTARQASNALVKFATYSKLKTWAEGRLQPGEKLGILGTFGIGMLSGIASV